MIGIGIGIGIVYSMDGRLHTDIVRLDILDILYKLDALE